MRPYPAIDTVVGFLICPVKISYISQTQTTAVRLLTSKMSNVSIQDKRRTSDI